MKNLMTAFAILMISLNAISALASPLDEASDTVVKTESGRMKGSGLLLAIGRKIYVLTSEHVVLHGNGSDIEHTVSNARIGRRRADLVAADVGSGLALLEVVDLAPQEEFPKLSDFEVSGYSAGTRVSALGFPLRVNSLFRSNSGEIANPFSERGSLPGTPWMIELSRTQADYGMSGGPIYDRSTGLILGVLSHQYVKMVPGSPSEIGEFGAGSVTIENTIVAIPASSAKAWIISALNKNFNPWMIRDPSAQRAGKTVFSAFGVKMSLVNATSDTSQPIGGDGVGIGGDGVGIGGDTVAGPKAKSVKILLSADPATAGWRNGLAPNWIIRARKAVVSGKTLEISAFLKGNNPASIEWIAIRSAAHFVNLLARTDIRPVIELPSGSGMIPPSIEKAAAQLTQSLNLFNDGDLLPDLVSRLRSVASFAKSAEWAALSDELLIELGNSREWDGLFSTRFDETIEVLKSFRSLCEEIGRNRK